MTYKPGKYPIDRPCSACSDGDTEMKYHNHQPPFREGFGPSEPKAGPPNCQFLYKSNSGKNDFICGMPASDHKHRKHTEYFQHEFVGAESAPEPSCAYKMPDGSLCGKPESDFTHHSQKWLGPEHLNHEFVGIASKPGGPPSSQTCPTCGTDIRCIHGKLFSETCEPCEAPDPEYVETVPQPVPTVNRAADFREWFKTRGMTANPIQLQWWSEKVEMYIAFELREPVEPVPTQQAILAMSNKWLLRYREAIDAMYNSGEIGRKLVIEHFGLWHPETEAALESRGKE